MRVIVSYDISNDKRRRKVAKILEGYGYRVQYSVFECDLEPKKLVELKKRLRPYVKRGVEESIRFYPLPEDALKKVVVMGFDLSRTLGPLTVV